MRAMETSIKSTLEKCRKEQAELEAMISDVEKELTSDDLPEYLRRMLNAKLAFARGFLCDIQQRRAEVASMVGRKNG